jgi:hypothetical protein
VPEAIVNVENVTPVTMEEVVSRLRVALVKVVSNKGAPGPDGQTVDELLAVADVWSEARCSIDRVDVSTRRDSPRTVSWSATRKACRKACRCVRLLSNIVLDELDWELDRRGHKFACYADDANVYVRSERAGLRVMASLAEFIEGRLRLKINQAKSAVACPEDRHFLGFRLRLD